MCLGLCVYSGFTDCCAEGASVYPWSFKWEKLRADGTEIQFFQGKYPYETEGFSFLKLNCYLIVYNELCTSCAYET